MGNKVSGTNITARPSVHAPSADEPTSTSTPRDQTVVLPCGESCHVIGSSISQFSSQMGLCAQQRKDLLVTKSDAKVPPACVADTSEGFFFLPFFFFGSPPSTPSTPVHSCVNAVTYSIVNESWVHTGTRYTVHICFICSLSVQLTCIYWNIPREVTLDFLLFAKLQKLKIQSLVAISEQH